MKNKTGKVKKLKMFPLVLLLLLPLGALQQSFPSSLDGSGRSTSGASGDPFLRLLPASSSPATSPSPRTVSRTLFGRDPSPPLSDSISPVSATFGFLLAHDLCLSRAVSPPVRADIQLENGGATPYLVNSAVNDATPWIDASGIYGTAATGLLREGARGRLLVNATTGLPLAYSPGAGRPRRFRFAVDMLNVTPQTQALAIALIREHNRKAELVAAERPDLTDEDVFQRARAWVGAILQKAAVEEYLPGILSAPLPQPKTTRPSPGVYLEFCSAAFRYAHTAVVGTILLRSSTGAAVTKGNLLLRDHLLSAEAILSSPGGAALEDVLLGMVSSAESKLDDLVEADMLNYLPSQIVAGAITDVLASDIQRGRDGLVSDYGATRKALNLNGPPCASDTITSLYGGGAVDLLVGGLCESQGKLGETLSAIIAAQFALLRDSDPWWYTGSAFATLHDPATLPNLSQVFLDNTKIGAMPAPPFSRTSKVMTTESLLGASPSSSSSSGASGPGTSGFTDLELLPGFKLSWKLDGTTVYFKLKVIGNACWVGLGLGTNVMKGADIVVGFRDPVSGAMMVQDMHAPANALPIVDLQQNLLEGFSSFSITPEGDSVLTFARKLDTGDAVGDNVLDPSALTPIIFARGSAPDSLEQHLSGNRGWGSIDLRGISVSSVKSAISPDMYLHALGMISTWLVVAPLAVMAIRYFKSSHKWYLSVHRTLLSFGLGSLIPLFIVAMLNNGVNFLKNYHTLPSIIFLVLAGVQAGLGNSLGSRLDKPTYAVRHRYPRKAHRWVGRVLLAGGLVQIGSGMWYLAVPRYWWTAVFAWIGFCVGLVVLFEFRNRHPNARIIPRWLKGAGLGQTAVVATNALPVMSEAAFDAAARRGLPWVTLGGFVLNLDGWAEQHPGGSTVIKNFRGQDITQAFAGKSKASKHVHGAAARARAKTMRIARLPGTLAGGPHDLEASKGVDVDMVEVVVWDIEILVPGPSRAVVEITTHLKPGLTIRVPPVLPGQSLSFLSPDAKETRYYTPVTFDPSTGEASYLVRVVEGGVLSPFLASRKVDDVFKVNHLVPHGQEIVLPTRGVDKLLFMVGGTGLASVMLYLFQTVEEAGSNPNFAHPEITLLFFNRGAPFYRDHLEALVKRAAPRLVLKVHFFDSSPGATDGPMGFAGAKAHPSPALVQAFASENGKKLTAGETLRLVAMFSGPPGFNQRCSDTMLTLGIPLSHFRSIGGQETLADPVAPLQPSQPSSSRRNNQSNQDESTLTTFESESDSGYYYY
jgi:NAD(P)H-flavin reductase/cytochrome b involved in lipid metabolism